MTGDWLIIYTIYRRPADHPDAEYVIRGFVIGRGGNPEPQPWIAVATTLDGARALVPKNADYCMPRSPDDLPEIVESWM